MSDDFDDDECDDDDDPMCSECGCDLFTEEHDWDCAFYGDDDDDEDMDDDEGYDDDDE